LGIAVTFVRRHKPHEENGPGYAETEEAKFPSFEFVQIPFHPHF
jgi:hypothetical protein